MDAHDSVPTRLTTADVLAEALATQGVRHIFGMPGSHSVTLYDAIGRLGFSRTLLFRNEQAAAYAADGYARVSGQFGVVCTTAGPGATNALSGLAEAWADSVPVLLLSGQVNADRLDVECGAYHEIDLEAIYRPVTRFAATLRAPDQLEGLVQRAFAVLTTGRRRPAALFLPQDLMRAEAADNSPSQIVFDPEKMRAPLPDRAAIAQAAARLLAARRPILLAGGGALWSGAAEALTELARRLDAPIVTTLNGKGLLDERSPQSLGHARSARARVALPQADAMLAVGCRFTEVMTGWRTLPVSETLIQIDIDPGQIGMNHPVAVAIVADARAALEAILPLIPHRERGDGDWDEIREEARAARPARPEWLIETLREVVPDDTPVFADACEMGYRIHTDYPAHRPRTVFYPSNYIALGWGFPAALGGAVALGGDRPVVSVSGDGGFVMTAQELGTAVRHELPVIAIVHNDSTYGAIKNLQQRDHAGRYRDVDLNNPDFLTLARAYDVPATRVSHSDAFRTALRDALGRRGPSLIEVPDQWRKLRV